MGSESVFALGADDSADDANPGCVTCRWSIGTFDGLYCELYRRMVTAVCAKYEREPGTDA